MSDYIKREDVLSAFELILPDVFVHDADDNLVGGFSLERCKKVINSISASDVK